MQIQTDKFTIITPTDGMWLCNHKAKTFSQKVYLGINADASDWTEITVEEKERLEAEWESESEPESSESEYAEAGKILLGVSE